MIELVKIAKSTRADKKWTAHFNVKGRQHAVHFGARGYDDYTTHKDRARMQRYQTRHANDNIDDPLSPGALSWYVLWTSTSFDVGVKNYLHRFSKQIKG